MRKSALATAIATLFLCEHAAAATEPAAGYIYARSELLAEPIQSCIEHVPGGVFVGNGPAAEMFPPDAKTGNILFLSESGLVTTVATGLNSISDCAYDAASDILYVTDSGADFPGATTGDTVFAIPGASSNVDVGGFELIPANSLPFASSVVLTTNGLLVGDAAGGGVGTVVAIDLSGETPATSVFASGFDYTGGVLVDGASVLVAESLDPTFDTLISQYSSAGVFQSTFAGPTYDVGSNDLAKAADGSIVAVGAVTIASIDDGVVTPLVTGLNGGGLFDAFGLSVAVEAFTGRIDFLASTFTAADDDKAVHRLVPIDRLVTGRGDPATECTMEIYGLELVPPAPDRPARSAICVDGAACDADGAVDGGCTFPVGICLNVHDARLGECAPTSVASIDLASAKPESDAVDTLIEDLAATLPTAESTCAFSDGIRLPLREVSEGEFRRGKGVLRLRARRGDEAAQVDRDVVRLVCVPAS